MAAEPSPTNEDLQELCRLAVEEGSIDAAFVVARSGMYLARELRPGATIDTTYLANLGARVGEDWVPQIMRDDENTVVDGGGRGGVHGRVLSKNAVLIVIFPSATSAEHVRTLVTELLRPSRGPNRPRPTVGGRL